MRLSILMFAVLVFTTGCVKPPPTNAQIIAAKDECLHGGMAYSIWHSSWNNLPLYVLCKKKGT